VLIEFVAVLQRQEALVLEAFEIEVDDLLHSSVVRSWTSTRGLKFTGVGSRVEVI
jgi:hypothetical protein